MRTMKKLCFVLLMFASTLAGANDDWPILFNQAKPSGQAKQLSQPNQAKTTVMTFLPGFGLKLKGCKWGAGKRIDRLDSVYRFTMTKTGGVACVMRLKQFKQGGKTWYFGVKRSLDKSGGPKLYALSEGEGITRVFPKLRVKRLADDDSDVTFIIHEKLW